MPDSEEGRSYLGRAYLGSWGSLTSCLGMPGVRGGTACLLWPKRPAKNEHLFLPWQGPEQRNEDESWKEQTVQRT